MSKKNIIKAETPDIARADTTNKPPEQADDFLTANELAAKLKIGRGALRSHMKAGLIPFVKLGPRKYIFVLSSVKEALIRQQRTNFQ